MKLFILSLTLAAVLVSAKKLEPQELLVSFREALSKFQPENALTFLRSGSNGNDEHFLSFCKFAQEVEDHNTNDGEHWQGEINAFAVMTESERQQYLGLNVSSLVVERREPHKARVLEKREDKVAVDYSEYLPRIKNQGSCGSCWAFGAVAALEYQLNRRRTSTTPVALSEQQYLDCVYEGSSNGCDGGFPSACYDWTRDNGNMIAKQSDYQYRAADGLCQGDKTSAIAGMQMVGVNYLEKTDAAMLTAVKDESIGVLSVAIGVYGVFSSYKSGVYFSSSCSYSVNHAVDVVGYGTLNGEDYWNVRNSWGPVWGDKGHIKMKRGVNTCAIADFPHYPYLTGTPEEEDDDEDDDTEYGCGYGLLQRNTGLLGEVLSGMTTNFTTNPEWMEGRTFEENVQLCKDACLKDARCAGLVFSPDNWDHQECFLMTQDVTFSNDRWSSVQKTQCEEDEEEKKTCTWLMKEGYKLGGNLSQLDYNMEEAKEKCNLEDSTVCAGISCINNNKCMLNKRAAGRNDGKFTSYVRKNCDDDNDGCPSGTMRCGDGECKHEHMC